MLKPAAVNTVRNHVQNLLNKLGVKRNGTDVTGAFHREGNYLEPDRRFGRAFLEVIAGAQPEMHPARRALAGKPEGALFDRLMAVQLDLQRGPDGTDKPLSCSTAQIKRIAESRPAGADSLARHLDAPRLDRFGDAFLAEITRAE